MSTESLAQARDIRDSRLAIAAATSRRHSTLAADVQAVALDEWMTRVNAENEQAAAAARAERESLLARRMRKAGIS